MKFVIFFMIFICSSCNAQEKLEKTQITITDSTGKSHSLTVELAKTEKQRATGFMFRKNIPEGTVMLFVFQRDERLSFWMKDTPTPLSIAYISATGEIRAIFDMKPFSKESVQSPISVRYALEVPQGWFDKVGIKIGDFLNLKKF